MKVGFFLIVIGILLDISAKIIENPIAKLLCLVVSKFLILPLGGLIVLIYLYPLAYKALNKFSEGKKSKENTSYYDN
ncbi:hypothetical protein [Wukongibacter baidiensis]